MEHRLGDIFKGLATLPILLGLVAFLLRADIQGNSPPDPILVIVNQAYNLNVYGAYLGEILRAEGLNAFTLMDISKVKDETLQPYRLVLLSQTSLTAAQSTLFTKYVASGGRLIAMRPDAQIAGLFNLGATNGKIDNGYVKLNGNAKFAGAAPGLGLASVPMQIHGSADQYSTTTGAVLLAQLYSDAKTPTPYPAVVGSANGQAVAFTYDLPSSIVLMRQGNPANANQDVDNDDGVFRTIELFQSGGGGAPWVDRNLIPIPQADEQQRFLARLIKQMLAGIEPLPQLWYFPGFNKTVMVLTGDAHANPDSYYQNEINGLIAYGATMTFYISLAADPSLSVMQSWQSQGFTFGLHPYANHPNNYAPYNCLSLEQCYVAWNIWFNTQYPNAPRSPTVRTHQVAWLGWTDAADLEAKYGIGMDTSFYIWGGWVQKPDGTWPHGYSTGSGLPMKFIRADGSIIPVFQQPTELIDEQLITGSGGGYEKLSPSQAVEVSKALIDASQNGYYSAITTQFHVDYYSNETSFVAGTLAYARSLNIPLWNADQWYSFTFTRYSANYTDINWDGVDTLTFNLQAPATPGVNLTTLLPALYMGKPLVSVSVDGTPKAFTTQKIRGVDEVLINVSTGLHSFKVFYSNSILPTKKAAPTITTPTPSSTNTPTQSPKVAALTSTPIPVFVSKNTSSTLFLDLLVILSLIIVVLLAILLIRIRSQLSGGPGHRSRRY
jgi:hypothetical protein